MVESRNQRPEGHKGNKIVPIQIQEHQFDWTDSVRAIDTPDGRKKLVDKLYGLTQCSSDRDRVLKGARELMKLGMCPTVIRKAKGQNSGANAQVQKDFQRAKAAIVGGRLPEGWKEKPRESIEALRGIVQSGFLLLFKTVPMSPAKFKEVGRFLDGTRPDQRQSTRLTEQLIQWYPGLGEAYDIYDPVQFRLNALQKFIEWGKFEPQFEYTVGTGWPRLAVRLGGPPIPDEGYPVAPEGLSVPDEDPVEESEGERETQGEEAEELGEVSSTQGDMTVRRSVSSAPTTSDLPPVPPPPEGYENHGRKDEANAPAQTQETTSSGEKSRGSGGGAAETASQASRKTKRSAAARSRRNALRRERRRASASTSSNSKKATRKADPLAPTGREKKLMDSLKQSLVEDVVQNPKLIDRMLSMMRSELKMRPAYADPRSAGMSVAQTAARKMGQYLNSVLADEEDFIPYGESDVSLLADYFHRHFGKMLFEEETGNGRSQYRVNAVANHVARHGSFPGRNTMLKIKFRDVAGRILGKDVPLALGKVPGQRK